MLTIKKEHNDGTVYFDELRSGDLFISNNTTYLVLEEGCCYVNPFDHDIIPSTMETVNAVCLINGLVEYFENNDKVKKIDSATLTLNV